MKKLLGLVAAAVIVAAAPAKAAPLLFTLTGNDSTASFTLDSNPTGTAVTNDDGSEYFAINNVMGSFSGPGDTASQGNGTGPQVIGDLQFYRGVDGGGIGVNETNGFGLFSLEGAQVFTGDVSDPTFSAGTFTFNQDFFFGETSSTETLTISAAPDAVSAAPEPGAWALMLGGVGAMGLMFRRRRTAALAA